MRNTTKLFLLGLLLSSAHTSHAFAHACKDGATSSECSTRTYTDEEDNEITYAVTNALVCESGEWAILSWTPGC